MTFQCIKNTLVLTEFIGKIQLVITVLFVDLFFAMYF